MIPTTTTPVKHSYYRTTTLCPFCSRLMPGEVFGKDEAVYLSRECPEHGHVEALVCSDSKWFEGLKRFDVAPIKPAHPQRPVGQGCPLIAVSAPHTDRWPARLPLKFQISAMPTARFVLLTIEAPLKCP